MIKQNFNINFYITRDESQKDLYHIQNLYTDYFIHEYLTREEVKDFLQNNDPHHPMLKQDFLQYQTQPSRVDETFIEAFGLSAYQKQILNLDESLCANGQDAIYPQSYQHYITSESLCYNGSGEIYPQNNYIVSENQICSSHSIPPSITEDSDSDDEDESYGDSHHLPYITGSIRSRVD